MVTKMNTKVEFCGKPRKFQRCPNRALVDYQKTMDDIRERMIPLAEEERNTQFKIDELNEEKDAINKHIELLEKLEDPSDEEIRECISLTKERIKIQKQIHDVRIEFSDSNKEKKALYEKLDKELQNAYCDFAKTVFKDFSDEDFKEVDDTDLLIAPRLGDLYKLATTGATQKEMDKFFKKIVKASFQ